MEQFKAEAEREGWPESWQRSGQAGERKAGETDETEAGGGTARQMEGVEELAKLSLTERGGERWGLLTVRQYCLKSICHL